MRGKAGELRQWLSERGTKPIIPSKSNRKQPFSFDRKSYKQRHRIENAFCRLKDFRRIAILETFSPPSVSSLALYGGVYESGS